MSTAAWTRIGKLVAIGAVACAWSAGAETELGPTLKISAEERYDTDLLIRQDNPVGTGQLITKLSPQIGLDVKDHTLTGTSFYAGDVYLRHGSGVAGVDHRGAIELKKAVSRTTRFEARLKIWRVSDPTSSPRLGLAREIAPILFSTGELVGAVRLSPRALVRAGYLFEGVKVYEADRSAPAFLNSPYLEVWYRTTPRSEVGAEYRFQYFSLGNSSADSNGVATAYRYHFTRQMKLTAKAGPTWFHDHTDPSHSGWVPRANLELMRQVEHFEAALVLGHDLTGATGFTSALWADYAALTGAYKVLKELSVFGAASYFRNGRAPNDGIGTFNYQAVNGAAQGYAAGGGVEWRVAQHVALQGALNRIAQVAGPAGGVDLSRNLAAVRVVITAL